MWNTIKTNKKGIFLVIIVLVVVFLVYEYFSSRKTAVSQPALAPTPSSSSEEPTAEKVAISKEISSNTRGDILFNQNKDYQIIYFSKEKQFLISVLGSPFDQKRALAEQSFLDTLGISQKEACQLNTTVTTPSFANPGQSGINYKLSFCDK